MNTFQLDRSTIELLSEIVGRELDTVDLTPSVTFLATLVTLLEGVAQADGQLLESEREKLMECRDRFLPDQEEVHQLVQELSAGVESLQIYNQLNAFSVLAAPLTSPQRVLLLGMAYEVATADSNLCSTEIEYLQKVANSLSIDHGVSEVLVSKFTGKDTDSTEAVKRTRNLLDPANFHELDICFIKAASDLSTLLFPELEAAPTQDQHSNPSSFNKLHDFQLARQELDRVCESIFQMILDGEERGWLSGTLKERIMGILKKIHTQSFRLAVIGEFSQGKSTLLNAMVGEKIQPTRAIPCSGTITTLRHGDRKRVICRYYSNDDEDVREEEIPPNENIEKEYQNRAAMSKEAANKNKSEALLDKAIPDEIVFEHPNLSLCKNGVEILDSPGLNENPKRTKITQKLLENVDAVIFLLNAQRALSDIERELIDDVRSTLNKVARKEKEEPAQNLFLVVNFIDLLEEDEDHQDVRERLETYVQEKNLISDSAIALHYISAKKALDALLKKNTQDEFLKSFQFFLKALEQFLATEPGVQSLRRTVTELENLTQQVLTELQQVNDIADGKVSFSEIERQRIIDQIGEISGKDIKIQEKANLLKAKALEQLEQSFSVWGSQLAKRLEEISQNWKSEYSQLWSRDKIAQDYADQFVQSLKKELDHFSTVTLSEQVLKPNIEELVQEIGKEFEELQHRLRTLDKQANTNFSQQLNLKISELTPDSTSGIVAKGFGAVGTLLGVAGAGLFLFSGLGLAALAPLAVFTMLGKATGETLDRGVGALNSSGVHNKIKKKVCEEGLRKFEEVKSAIRQRLNAAITPIFDQQAAAAKATFKQVMLSCENTLELQERAYQETIEERQATQSQIEEYCQRLEQLQQEARKILNRYLEQN